MVANPQAHFVPHAREARPRRRFLEMEPEGDGARCLVIGRESHGPNDARVSLDARIDGVRLGHEVAVGDGEQQSALQARRLWKCPEHASRGAQLTEASRVAGGEDREILTRREPRVPRTEPLPAGRAECWDATLTTTASTSSMFHI